MTACSSTVVLGRLMTPIRGAECKWIEDGENISLSSGGAGYGLYGRVGETKTLS
jgi:hypothetical protein